MNKLDEMLLEYEPGNELAEKQEHADYQRHLFLEYVLRGSRNLDERLRLKKEYDTGLPLMGERGLRKKLAAIDLEYFGRAYLPHYFVRDSPQFHEELDEIWINSVLKGKNPLYDAKDIARMDGSHSAIAAPRGHAKSTTFTFKDTIHAALYQYKHYIILLSDSSEQAEGFLTDIKSEFEDNENILQDFGRLQGKVWKNNVMLTRTNIKIEAIGSGKKIRGRRHQAWRPDLIVLDDIENDENVNTPEQRKKLDSWYKKAVEKSGDTYTDIMYIGTILHYDSLLANTLKNPEYESKTYRAIISEAENRSLWEDWERLYTNLFDEDHKETARKFYEAHKSELLKGTVVLWPEKMDYYKLMVAKVSGGESAFNSEYQNNPIDPENAAFNLEWLDYYESELIDFGKDNFIFIGSNDPSLGKNKKSDTSSIINLALDLNTGYMYVADADIEKRKPDIIIKDIFDMSARLKRDYRKGFYKFGVETVQFQYFFKEVMATISVEIGEYLPIEEIQSILNKRLRIESLQPFIKNKFIKFNKKHKTLLKQLEEYPMGKNDDGPDGLQMAVALAILVKQSAKKINYKTILKRKLGFEKGAY